MKTIKQLKNIKGKFVLVRVDFNVPFKDGVIEDDFRIRKAIPTIKFLKDKGAKIILISHLGKGGESLLPVSVALSKFIKNKFVPDIIGKETHDAILSMKNKDVILLENLRNEQGEQANSKDFAKNLAKLADIYVNECFSVCHREDASIVQLPKLLPSYAGFQLTQEINNLSKVFKNTKKPFLFILGGAKFSTKMPLIKKYLKGADNVFIGGALANDFLKAKGYEVGKSLVSESFGIEKIINNKKLLLPIDVVISDGTNLINKKVNEVAKNDVIVDIGKESIIMLKQYINNAKLILWNGPLGLYEHGGDKATSEILMSVSKVKAESIIGGGDTVSLISEMKLEKKFTFVSTGGGATLDFLAAGTLPGIKVLK